MDKKELKNEIVNLFCETFVKYPDDADHYEHWREHIADEFIAAGIGDVSEVVKEFANDLQNAIVINELIRNKDERMVVLAEIEELVKEVCGND